ncbi:unnamed protein product [Diamesa hyperborea]
MEDNEEIILLKTTIDAYKLLNRKLSMEEQELKIQLNQKIQMLEVTRNELNEERENNALYKHFIKTKITMCSQIFSSVINNLNDCIETTESDISIPNGYDGDHYSSNEEREHAGPSSRVNPK